LLDELIARVRRAGTTGELTIRMDSGSGQPRPSPRCGATGVRYSITVRLTKSVRQQIAAIPETCGCQKVGPWALSCQFVFCPARPG
jgi:hypothetical protein